MNANTTDTRQPTDTTAPLFHHACDLPDLVVPEARRFCHRTRMADSWTPQTETVLLPGRTISSNARVTVTRSTTDWRPDHAWQRFQNRSPLDLHDRVFFDTRMDHQNNPAHVLHWMWLRIAFAWRTMSKAGFTDHRPVILLRSDAAALAKTAWGILGYETIETDRPVTGLQLTVDTSPTASFAGLLPELMAGIPTDLVAPPQKIYIARRNSRSVTNETAILPLLESHGFRRVFMEDHPLLEQWRMLASATEVVGVHGAGLAAMIFAADPRQPVATNGRYLIELHGPGYIVDLYRNFAAATGGRWCAIRGKITSGVVHDLDELDQPRGRETDPFTIDPANLEEAFHHVRQPTF